MLSHPQSVLQEWLASCILSLSMTLFLGPDHWRPHSEAVALCSPQRRTPGADQVPFVDLREQLPHLHFHIYGFRLLSAQNPGPAD